MSENLSNPSTLVPAGLLSQEYFERRYAEAGVLADQNDRYADALTDPVFAGDQEAFRDLAVDGIYTEQLQTIEGLLAQSTDPYEQISVRYEAVADELTAAQQHLKSLEALETPEEARVRQAAQRAAELAPLAGGAANELAHSRIEALKAMGSQALARHIGELSHELGKLRGLHDIAAQPWPVPVVVRDKGNENRPDWMVVDEIPVEPDVHDIEDEVMRKLIERHGTTHQASLLLTKWLKDNPDTIFTPGALGEALYTDESHFVGLSAEEREECIRKRIHRLLNRDALVGRYLEESGFRLQYGWRHFIDSNTGQDIRRKRRIYRAVVLQGDDTGDTFEEIVHTVEPPQAATELFHKPTRRHSPAAVEAIENETRLTKGPLPDKAVLRVVQICQEHGLLPRNVDDIIPVPALQLNVLRLDMRAADRADRVVLQRLRKAIMAWPKTHATARMVVTNGLDLSAKELRKEALAIKVSAQVNALLLEFYENHSLDSKVS